MTNIPQLSNIRALHSEILVDTGINSRQTADDAEETKIKKLADSMRVQGVLHPPIVMRLSQAGKGYEGKAKKGEQYLLIAGFRRHAAMGELGVSEADYRLAPSHWGLKEAMAANMVENLQREDLTHYDTAMQCARIAENFKLSGAEIAKMIRAYDSNPEGKQALSEQHVNNLIRLVRKLHPAILKAWKEGHKAASMRTLIKIAGNDDHQAQMTEWKALTEAKGGKGKDKEEGEGKGKDKAKRKPTDAQIVIMIERVKESKRPEEWKKGAIDALKWASGTADKIPGVAWEADAGKAKTGRKRKGGNSTADAGAAG